MPRIFGFCCLLLIGSLQERTAADKEVLASSREHIPGVTYESLHDVFQSYPVDRENTDQTWKFFGNCDGLSGYRETTHTSSPQSSRRISKPCYSILKNCRLEDSMGEFVHFCVSSNQHRRYDYMMIDKTAGQVYGRKLTGKCPSSKFEIYYSHGTYYPCLCDCESSEWRVDRYFSLLDVVSDNDKVVTGFRFRKVDHVFYIQIQQAKQGPNRMIDGRAEWKDLDTISNFDLLTPDVSNYSEQDDIDEMLLKFYKNDFVYAVTSEQNTILLDDLVGGPNEVLTGLRFRHVGQDLGLEIQVTPYHEGTGTLERNASRWLHNDVDKSERVEVKLPTPKVPSRREEMDILSFGQKFIRFQVSDFKTDLGQTTVPFISITEVVPGGPQLLSGAGIFYKGSSRSAGFIAPKVFFP